MDIKIKKKNTDGIVRLETKGVVKEVYMEEDFKTEKVNICFRGKSSSGIITMTPKEIESLYLATKKMSNLVGEVKSFKVEKKDSLI